MKSTTRKSLQGIPISSGLVVGRLAKTSRSGHASPHSPLVIHTPDEEWQKYSEARGKALQQIEELRKEAAAVRKGQTLQAKQNPTGSADEALPEVMLSYSMLLDDEVLTERIKKLVFSESLDATSAILQAFRDVKSVVQAMENEYLRDKVLDLDACEDMLLSALSDNKNLQSHQWSHLKGRIVVINHPTPQDIIRFHQVGVAGIIAEHGSQLSHAAILARSFNIPAVFSVPGISHASNNGQMTILNAHEGKLIIQPSRSEIRKAEARRAVELMMQQKLKSGAQAVARTTDGRRIFVFANANGPIDSRALTACGAEGIGLFRTEFLHAIDDGGGVQNIPLNEDQLTVFFRLTAEAVSPRWATFRLLDCGGDKPYPIHNTLRNKMSSSARGGVFGLRGVRFLLAEEKILETQLRALLRANVTGNIRILIPFVTDLNEIRRIKALTHALWSELSDEERRTLQYPSIGAMIETPAAVQMVEHFSSECDFLSVGSNDLTQHYLCVERDNDETSTLYNSFHPAILKCLRTLFDHQQSTDIGMSLCGELASEPAATELLIGLGCTQISCRPSAIPLVKEIIRRTSFDEAKKFAESLLRLSSAEEIQDRAKQRYEELYSRYSMASGSRTRAS